MKEGIVMMMMKRTEKGRVMIIVRLHLRPRPACYGPKDGERGVWVTIESIPFIGVKSFVLKDVDSTIKDVKSLIRAVEKQDFTFATGSFNSFSAHGVGNIAISTEAMKCHLERSLEMCQGSCILSTLGLLDHFGFL